MNITLLLMMIPDALLDAICGDLHKLVDALKARDIDEMRKCSEFILNRIVVAVEQAGVPPAEMVAVLKNLMPEGFELPFDLEAMIAKHQTDA